MLTVKPLNSRPQATTKPASKQNGFTSVSMAVMLTVAAIVTVATAKMAINTAVEKKGASVGAQLLTLTNALDAYITKNNAALSSATSRNTAVSLTQVASPPTIATLKAGGYLNSGFIETPTVRGSYVININVVYKVPPTPITTPCTVDCNIIGQIYIDTPVTTTEGQIDFRLLGAAQDSSAENKIGFSGSLDSGFIYSKSGPIATNPKVSAQGVLLSTTAISYNNNNLQYWRKPVASITDLPQSDNSIGDGRFKTDTYKPMVWGNHTSQTTASWSEVFSNSKTQSVSIGTSSGNIIDYTTSLPAGNTLIGYESGKLNTSAYSTFVGANSGKVNNGNYNTFVGYNSGLNNTTGFQNVFIGMGTGLLNTTGSSNLFAGSSAGRSNTTGSNNIFLGNAGTNTTTGSANVSIGNSAGMSNTTGIGNINIGHFAGLNNIIGSNTINIGRSAGIKNLADDNVYIGSSSGTSNIGTLNTFVGTNTGANSTTASNNTYIGHNAGRFATTATSSTIVGSQAGYNNNSDRNTFVGYKAGYSTLTTGITAVSNTMVGAEAGRVGSGASNTFLGDNSGYGMIGNNNTTIGANSGFASPSNLGTSGDNNTIIGNNAKAKMGIANSMALGADSYVDASNKIRIGNTSITEIGGEVPWSNLSDRRGKIDIKQSQRGLDFVNSLTPVDYTLKSNGLKQTGFIAQDVENIDPTFPGVRKPTSAEDHYSLTYTDFIPSVVKAVQEIDAKVNSQDKLFKRWQYDHDNLLILLCTFLTFCVTCLAWFVHKLRQKVVMLENRMDHLASFKHFPLPKS